MASQLEALEAFKIRIGQKIKDNAATDNSRTKGVDHKQIEWDLVDTIAQLKAIVDLINAGTSVSPFSALRTADTLIEADEFRLIYASPSELTITDDNLPDAVNGKPLWFYNDGTANLLIPNVRQFDGTIGLETIEPGGRVALVGDGTNWRYQ